MQKIEGFNTCPCRKALVAALCIYEAGLINIIQDYVHHLTDAAYEILMPPGCMIESVEGGDIQLFMQGSRSYLEASWKLLADLPHCIRVSVHHLMCEGPYMSVQIDMMDGGLVSVLKNYYLSSNPRQITYRCWSPEEEKQNFHICPELLHGNHRRLNDWRKMYCSKTWGDELPEYVTRTFDFAVKYFHETRVARGLWDKLHGCE